MSWIQLNACKLDEPEIHQIATTLGLSPDEVLGKLVRLWVWLNSQTTDGKVTNIHRTLVDQITRCDGFADALLSVGWMIKTANGYAVPNHECHTGDQLQSKGFVAREENVSIGAVKDFQDVEQLQATLQDEIKQNFAEALVTTDEPCGSRQTKSAMKFDPTSLPLPEPLSTPEFASAWNDWCRHRIEIKKRLTPTQSDKCLKMLAKLGSVRAIETINHTVAMGWQGLRVPDQLTITRESEDICKVASADSQRRTQEFLTKKSQFNSASSKRI